MEFFFDSPLGKLLLIFSGNSLVALRVLKADEGIIPAADRGGAYVSRVCDWLSDYFDGKNPTADNLDIRTRGSVFQEKVWALLKRLPYGYCVTYGYLASLLVSGGKGRLMARAVGNALASNPIWIIIPCHRVIRSDGELGNYAGGLAMKKALLRLEGVDLPASSLN